MGEDPGKGRLDTSPPKGAPLLHKVVNQETASVFLNIYLFSRLHTGSEGSWALQREGS